MVLTVKILLLNEQDMKKVFTMEDAIKADKDALKFYSKGETCIPLRTNLAVPEHNGQSLYMPGYVAGANALGIKIISVYPDNINKGIPTVPAFMVLVDNKTGQVCAAMDGTYLTKVRTGALAGAATDILARKDSEIYALIGTGGQAETHLEAVLTVRNIKEVRVYSRNRERVERFVERMRELYSERFKVNIVAATSSDEAVKDADIITCVTTSKEPVFDGKLIKKGVHINGMGSYTPDMQELDEYVVLNSDKIYVDTLDGVLNESGDFIIPMKENKFSEKDITGELGEVIIGKAPGREREDEITLFKSVGSGVFDLVTARRIYEKAIGMGIGQMVEF